MKIQGKVIEGPNVITFVIPRSGRDDIVMRAGAVLDYDAFEALCPAPIPPTVQRPGKENILDVTDEKYNKALMAHIELKTDYMVLQSLTVTEGLEWETVTLKDPSTWVNWRTEVKDAGFTPPEIGLLISKVTEANGLDQAKLEEALAGFLTGPPEGDADVLIPMGEQPSIQSGEPVNDSE